jgi:hypothetical protein
MRHGGRAPFLAQAADIVDRIWPRVVNPQIVMFLSRGGSSSV